MVRVTLCSNIPDVKRASLLLAAAMLVQGCASAACTPVSVVVERKEEPEYWVLGQDGRWYLVSEADWRAAEPGRPLSLCR